MFVQGLVFKPPRYGAYTELFAALSPQIDESKNGCFVIPWGRIGPVPSHIEKSMKQSDEGGPSLADKFWDWCEKEIARFQ